MVDPAAIGAGICTLCSAPPLETIHFPGVHYLGFNEMLLLTTKLASLKDKTGV